MLQRTLLRQCRVAQAQCGNLARSAGSPAALRTATRQPHPHGQLTSRFSRQRTLTTSSARWAINESTDQKANEDTSSEQSGESKTENEDPTKKEVEAKNREIIELKDKYLRSVADFRNLQDRTKREVQAAKDFAIQRFAKDLLDSVDNLDRALGTVSAEQRQPDESNAAKKDLINLYDGLKMTEGILLQTLKKHGLERFDPSEEGEQFNPNLHEATFQTPMEGKQDGTVFLTQQKGFSLNGRVLRAAKVGVVKNA